MEKEPGIQRAGGREKERARALGNETRSEATDQAALGRSLRQLGRREGVRGSAPPPAGRPTWPLGREEAPAGLPGIQLGAESGQVGGIEAHPPPRGRGGGQLTERGLCPQGPVSLCRASLSTYLASFLTAGAGPL